jgi:hypothetical protein
LSPIINDLNLTPLLKFQFEAVKKTQPFVILKGNFPPEKGVFFAMQI